MAANCGCAVVGCSEASSSGGHAAVTVPLPAPPPLCSRALPLELAVSLSRCMAGRIAKPSAADGVPPSVANPREQVTHQSSDDDAAEEGEQLGGRRDRLSGLSVQPTNPAQVPEEQAAGAGSAARTRVLAPLRPIKTNGDGAVTKMTLAGTRASVPEQAAVKQQGMPLPAVTTVGHSARTAQQSAALTPVGAPPSPPSAAASAAAAVPVKTKHAAKPVEKPVAATANQRVSQRAAAQAAAVEAPAASSYVSASAARSPQERTAAEEAALRAAAERETLLRQLNQQARLLIQVCGSADIL